LYDFTRVCLNEAPSTMHIGEMKDGLLPLDDSFSGVCVAQIALEEIYLFHATRQIVDPAAREIIGHGHGSTIPHKAFDEVAANEGCATRYQDLPVRIGPSQVLQEDVPLDLEIRSEAGAALLEP
jgi:hypothetical protein